MRCSEKVDARYQTLERLHERRQQVVSLYRQGHGVMQIVADSGLSYMTVRGVIHRFEQGGVNAIKPATRGKRMGQGRQLNEAQESAIRRAIFDCSPAQLGMPFGLWTRAAVMQLVAASFDIHLGLRGVGNYLARWGLTRQKPLKKALEQDTARVQAWLGTEYAAIRARAKAEACEIHWCDAAALPGACTGRPAVAPMGTTPMAFAVRETRHPLSMLSTVSNQGKTRWMVVNHACAAEPLQVFLQTLCQDVGKKVFVILGAPSTHLSLAVRVWLAQAHDKIELFQLGAGGPEQVPATTVSWSGAAQ